jgi:hypothetical protein
MVDHESGEQAEQTPAGAQPPAQQLPAKQEPPETGKKAAEERTALQAQAVTNWVHHHPRHLGVRLDSRHALGRGEASRR